MSASEQIEALGQQAVAEVHAQYDQMVLTAKEWQQKYEEQVCPRQFHLFLVFTNNQVHARERVETELSSSEQKLGQLDNVMKRLMSLNRRSTSDALLNPG